MANLEKLPPIHPGEIFREDFMKPRGISMNRLGLDLHVPVTRIAEIVHERRGISPDTAMRLGRYFNTSARFWLNAHPVTILKSRRTPCRALLSGTCALLLLRTTNSVVWRP